MKSKLLLIFSFVIKSSLLNAGISMQIKAQTPSSPPVQAPQSWQSIERAKILQGISNIPQIKSSGPVAIWGNLAFPIIAAADGGKAEMALGAAAGYGKGRAIIYGHIGYLNDNNLSGGSLLINSIKWVGDKERKLGDTEKKIRVGVAGVNLKELLASNLFDVETIVEPLALKKLKLYDVLVINAMNVVNEDEGQALSEFIKGGGGVVAGMLGWAFEQIHNGKKLEADNTLNKALMPAGLAFTDTFIFDGTKPLVIQTRIDLPRMMNAYEAVNGLKKHSEGGVVLSEDEAAQGINAIQIAMAAQPQGRTSLQTVVLQAVGNGVPGIPTANEPLTQSKHSSERIRLGIETRVMKEAPVENVEAHPAAAEFPGKAPDDAPRVNKEIYINPVIPGWASTGLWVNAGDAVTIKFPPEMADKGYSVRIGCHTDKLYGLESWKRVPDISRSISIKTAEMKAASAFGGLIYIEVPGKAKSTSPFAINIAGGIEAPLFVLGQDDDEKWNSDLKNRTAPWAEFACDKIILTCPSANARKIKNPTQLMEFWTKVVDAQDEISNQAAERKRPERIVADIQISIGYMHSGYPIMVPTSASDEMIVFNRIKHPGWGFYHELGHNHQRGDFTFEGTGEVTNNVIALYVYEHVLGEKTEHFSDAKKKQFVDIIKKADNKYAAWQSNPFLALSTYVHLVDAFGWDSWRKYLHSFADTSFGPTPKSDEEKRDQFLVRYSKIANKNLTPFFEAWGIPVSSSAKAEVIKLEPWVSKDM